MTSWVTKMTRDLLISMKYLEAYQNKKQNVTISVFLT